MFTDVLSEDGAADSQDYRLNVTTVTVPAGVTNVLVPVEIIDDDLNEETEDFSVRVSNPSANLRVVPSSGVTTVTILDDDKQRNGLCIF